MKNKRLPTFSERFLKHFIILACLGWALLFYVNVHHAHSVVRHTYEELPQSRLRILASSLVEALNSMNYPIIRHQCNHAISTKEFESVRIFDSAGVPLANCKMPGVKSLSGTDRAILNFLAIPKKHTQDVLDENGIRWGRIDVKINQAQAAEIVQRTVVRPAIMVAGFLFLIMGVSLHLVFQQGHYLEKLAEAVRLRTKYIEKDQAEPISLFESRFSRETQQIDQSITELLTRILHLRQELRFKAKLAGIGQTVTMFAHDARKPLSAIESFLNNFDSTRDDPKFVQSFLKLVRQAKVDLDRMMEDMLEFGHNRPLVKEDWELLDLVELAMVETADLKHGSTILFEYDFQHSRRLHIDKTEVKRVIGNILSNAFDAVDDGGKIWFRTKDVDCGDWMEIEIGNTGSFLSPEDRLKVFEPFFTSGKKTGTGLGLAIAYKVVTAHGGEISVESEKMKGTWFRFVLPTDGEREKPYRNTIYASLEEVRQAQICKLEEGEVKELVQEVCVIDVPLSLLIVDDEALFRRSLRTMVSKIPDLRGHVSIVEASSGEEALKLFEKARFDCAIVDVNMGEGKMNGFDLTREIVKRFPQKRVLIHSNLSAKDNEAKAREAGAQGFIPKPMDQEQLLRFLAVTARKVS